MTSRNLSETSDFIIGMGNRSSEKIPVIYREETKEVVINRGSVTTDRKNRYASGKTVLFKCLGCKDIIGKGKKTDEIEDKVKIYCYNCKNYHNYSGGIIWSKDNLWYKPEKGKAREDYEKLLESYLKNSKPEVLEI